MRGQSFARGLARSELPSAATPTILALLDTVNHILRLRQGWKREPPKANAFGSRQPGRAAHGDARRIGEAKYRRGRVGRRLHLTRSPSGICAPRHGSFFAGQKDVCNARQIVKKHDRRSTHEINHPCGDPKIVLSSFLTLAKSIAKLLIGPQAAWTGVAAPRPGLATTEGSQSWLHTPLPLRPNPPKLRSLISTRFR